MKINQDRLNQYLKKIHGPICSLCGQNSWTVSEHLFYMSEFDNKGVILGGAMFPVLPITCTACGNTHFINALIAGLIDKPDNTDNNNETKDNSSN